MSTFVTKYSNLSHCLFSGVVLYSAHFPEDHAVTEGHENEGTGEGYDAEKEEIVPVERTLITIINECHVFKNKHADCLCIISGE